ncbi:MAG TPA: tRNA epoxyqueuosine(34) reductase QueG [Verrucomicrobiae bacterium]|nr:tRNA epoxyqueuosine(34) reductase QueG [Verrucomicrobiae bacterium]
MKERVRQRALDLGFDACRFTTAEPPVYSEQFKRWIAQGQHGEMSYLARNASKRANPDLVLSGAKSVITLAVSYATTEEMRSGAQSRKKLSADQFRGIVARYARFTDYHDVIGEKLKALIAFVHQLSGSECLWYVDTGPLLERDLAQRAGLGFIGKHTNLISRTLGNWIFLSEIITTAEFEPDDSEQNHCGSCTQCLEACPTGAITAPFQLDARRCISYLTIELKGSIPVEFRREIGNRIYGCDDCLQVCPWNRFAREGNLMKPHARADLSQMELLELLSLDDAAFKQRFAGTPILRTKRRGLLRNVCIALGNVGDVCALPALTRAAADPEPLIVEHATWAIREITARFPTGFS